MSDWVYQEEARGEFYVQFKSVKLEDTTDVFYTSGELRSKMDPASTFSIDAECYDIGSNVYVYVGRMMAYVLDKFKDPKVKFVAVEIPGYGLPFYNLDFKWHGVGYSNSKGGFVRKQKPDPKAVSKQMINAMKSSIITSAAYRVAADYDLYDVVFKTAGVSVQQDNAVVMLKKMGYKKLEQVLVTWKGEPERYAPVTLDEKIALRFPSLTLLQRKTMKTELLKWWKLCKEVK